MSGFFLKLPTKLDCPYWSFKIITVIMDAIHYIPNMTSDLEKKNGGFLVKFEFQTKIQNLQYESFPNITGDILILKTYSFFLNLKFKFNLLSSTLSGNASTKSGGVKWIKE